jgi:hypothetical protein
MIDLPQQTRLYGLPEYRRLDDKRKKVARAMLLGDASLTAACRDAGLNASREKKNVDLQKCVWRFNHRDTSAGDGGPDVPFLSLYEKARRIAWLLGETTEAPDPAVEQIVWKLAPEEQIPGLPDLLELPARPTPLPADQIAAYLPKPAPRPAPTPPSPPVDPEPATPVSTPIAVVPNEIIAVNRGGQCRSCGASTPEGWVQLCSSCTEALGWG